MQLSSQHKAVQTQKSKKIVKCDGLHRVYHYILSLRIQTFVEFRFCQHQLIRRHVANFSGQTYQKMESFIMAKKFDWTFVEIKLEKKDKPLVEKFAESYKHDPLEILDDIAELGYKVSVSYVDDQNSYVVSVSGNSRTGINNQQTVTTWSGDLGECIAMAGYKVLKLSDGRDWKELETQSSNWG